MKRELLAKSLSQMADKTPTSSENPGAAAPRSLKNMSDVLSQVSAQAAQEVDVSEIADSEVADRFDVSERLDDVIESIRTSGQEIPVLLRYRRGHGPRYEVVYGRRRIAACRALGIKVKAYIKEMDEREALVSQALENSARLERSFIEQAVFATRLEEQGFERSEICEVLAVDKGTLSKLINVARDVPDSVIFKIGAAHDAGRRPWLELRRLLKLKGSPKIKDVLSLLPEKGSPVEKLTRLISELQKIESAQKTDQRASERQFTRKIEGAHVSFKATKNRLTIETKEKKEQNFIAYLEDRLSDLYQDWATSNPEVDATKKG